MSEIKINIEQSSNELIIREGQALELSHPTNFNLTGTITAPRIFYQKKKDNYDWKHGAVTVTDHAIVLHWGEHEAYGNLSVHGILKEDNALKIFGINSGHKHTQKSLGSLLKMNRVYFESRQENMQVVSNLERFKARVSQEIESGNDFKGNKKQLFEQQVQHDLQLSFSLSVPIYAGQSPRSFKVEINFDITDGSPIFWLESADLKEIQETERKRILDAEIQGFEDLAIIYQ